MSLATEIRPSRPKALPPVQRVRSPLVWVLLIQAAAFAVLVASGGSVLGRALRVLVVVAVFGASLPAFRRPSRARAWTSLVLGLAGLVAGVGIGVRYLQKSDLSAAGLAGVVSLVTGLTLCAVGTREVLRGVRRWRRLWAIPIAVAVLAFVLVPMSFALMATNVPTTSLGKATPATFGMTYADVTFKTSDGVLLSGWYIPSHNKGAVVLLHGSGSTRSGVLSHAIAIAQHGYGVLAFDARGHGRSAGRGMDFGWFGDLDIRAAVSYVSAQSDVDPSKIAIVGMSMGGEEAIGAAASDSRITAVVAEGATHRTYADDTEWLPRAPNGWIQRAIERIQYTAMDLTTSASPPIGLRQALTASAPRPTLIIAAGTIADEQRAARAFARGLPSVQTWVVPGAGHTGGLRTVPGEWKARVFAFLDRALHVGG
jgi:dienelactone hydrolase